MSTKLLADEVIALLELQPLPGEGGYFRQTCVIPGNDGPLSTAILYLLTPDSFSAQHKLEDPERFHVYLGDPCDQIVICTGGSIERRILGHDLASGHMVQSLIPADCWQATRLMPDGEHGYALLGTTMTPGYRPDRFTLATRHVIDQFGVEDRASLEPYLAPGTI